jgi:dephospho-CoA kinase
LPRFVFGYGSLVEQASLEGFLGRSLRAPGQFMVGRLHGYRRAWIVSSESADLKRRGRHFVDEAGRAVDDAVAALGIYEQPDHWINGALFTVGDADLQLLDRRERNYDRVDVSDRIECGATGPMTVLTYVPKPESVARTLDALRAGRCVVAQPYLDLVEAGFRQLGHGHLDAYHASSDPLPCPTAAIRRVDR